jgi:hypothetical protein
MGATKITPVVGKLLGKLSVISQKALFTDDVSEGLVIEYNRISENKY